MSKRLYHWTLLLASFRFCETQYLHFTTRVFGHSAISPFLGGQISYVTRESHCCTTHCNTVPHSATHCNTLQHAATHCTTLQHTATRCNTIAPVSCTLTHCNKSQHTATRCGRLQHAATRLYLSCAPYPRTDTLQHAATLCNTL